MPKRKLQAEVIEEEVSGARNWSELTIPKLKLELDNRELATSGRKAELVARLEAAEAEISARTHGSTNWSEFTVDRLKQELDTRGLAKSGRKAELIARLEAADNHTLAPTDAAPPRSKRTKREASPDIEIEGPLASKIIGYQEFGINGERRLRDFVPEPDAKYKDKLKRIRNERMFMLDRTKGVDRHGFECETFDIAGSTGNIYQTTIGRSPKCVCMDARMRGQKCKHINYALIIILKAPAHLCYQTAFLSEELAFIFANAPITRGPEVDHDHDHDHSAPHSEDSSYNGARKPIDGECPICVFDMDSSEDIVWCKASCGQNFHRECFEQWRRSKHGGRVTCVYCRAVWQEDGAPVPKRKPAPGSLASLKETAPKIGRYRNIGHHPMYRQGIGEG